jgi:hypothetical protein
MLEGGAGLNIAQFGLDHRPQIAGCVMSEFNYFARLALENDNHTSSYLRCRNRHKSSNLRLKKYRNNCIADY